MVNTPPLTIFVLHASDLLTDYQPHGDGLSAFGFLRALASRGHIVHVAAVDWAIREPLPPNLIVHPIRLRFKSGAASRAEYALRARLLFERLRKRGNFDIVQQMVPVKTGLSLGMVGIREPLVLGTYVARWPLTAGRYPWRQATYKRRTTDFVARVIASTQLFFARALLATSPAAASDFPLSALFRNRIFEIHHGIDVDAFKPSSEESTSRHNTILFLGSVAVHKGIFTLIEAFDLVHQRVPDARLVVAGTGYAEEQVRALLATLKCASQVFMIGSVTRPEVPGLMQSAAIFCAPAYGEPFATSLLEAMASGNAAVVTDSGGAPYMVPAAGGRCVKTRDKDSLAQALIELLLAPEETKAMGLCNREFAEREYSWDSVLKRLELVYSAIRETPPTHIDLTPRHTFGALASQCYAD